MKIKQRVIEHQLMLIISICLISTLGLSGDLQTYISVVQSSKRFSRRKKNYLLYKDDITKMDVVQKFIARNLIDTSYANRVVLNTLTDYFKANEIPTKVFTLNGNITHKFRTQINLPKDREEDTYIMQ